MSSREKRVRPIPATHRVARGAEPCFGRVLSYGAVVLPCLYVCTQYMCMHMHMYIHVGQRMLIAVIKNYNNKQRAGKRSGSIENRKGVKRMG